MCTDIFLTTAKSVCALPWPQQTCPVSQALLRGCSCCERVWVILPEHHLRELQRLPVRRLGQCILSLQVKRLCHVVYTGKCNCVILPEQRLAIFVCYYSMR